MSTMGQVVCPAPKLIAGQTMPTSVRETGIIRRVLVSLWAVGLRGPVAPAAVRNMAAAKILAACNQFQMRWVHTTSMSTRLPARACLVSVMTGVIPDKPCGGSANKIMMGTTTSLGFEGAIAIVGKASFPEPAGGGSVNHRPEPFFFGAFHLPILALREVQ